MSPEETATAGKDEEGKLQLHGVICMYIHNVCVIHVLLTHKVNIPAFVCLSVVVFVCLSVCFELMKVDAHMY